MRLSAQSRCHPPRGGETGGADHEDEDIRAHVIGFERLMALVASGEAGTGPLILSAYWLAANRARLRGQGAAQAACRMRDDQVCCLALSAT